MNSTRTIHGGWRRHHEGMKMGARHCTLRRAVQRIERLGYKVILEAAA